MIDHLLNLCLEVAGGLQLQLVRHGVDLEPIQPGHELVCGALGAVFGVHHEEHMGETGAEIGAVGVVVPRRLRGVNVHTFGAVQLHHRLPGDVRQPDGQHGLILAVDAGAVPEIALLVFLQHLRDAAVGEDVARVDEAVEHFGRLLDQIALVRVVLQLLVWLEVEDHVKRLSVVRHLLVQPRQVEFVLDVILVHLAEELVASQAAEPRDPRHLLGAAHGAGTPPRAAPSGSARLPPLPVLR